MNRHRTILSSLLILCAALLMQSCTDNDNPIDPSSTSVVGTWKLITMGGQNVSATGVWWNFTQTQSRATNELLGCSSTFNYTTSGNKLNLTLVSDGCDDEQPGSTTTLTYSISGNKMTITDDGVVYVFEKGQANSIELIGAWQVMTIDGETPRNSMRLSITPQVLSQTVTINGTDCTTQFTYLRSGATIGMTVLDDECDILEVGTSDQATFAVANYQLTLTFSDGTVLVAKKL